MAPPGSDIVGTIVVIAGALATLFAFAIAIRVTIRPGEVSAAHPKHIILRDDR